MALREPVCKVHDICGAVGDGGCVVREECLENEFVCDVKKEDSEESVAQTDKLCCDRGKCV